LRIDSYITLKKKKTMLDRIIEHKKLVVENKKRKLPLETLMSSTRVFPLRSIVQKTREKKFIIIAETKKASPSGGVFRKRYFPAKIAVSYEKAGASAVSVLTEDRYFFGCVEHLKAVKSSVKIPVLAKDFFIDKYQIYEAFVSGADCILLILKILSGEEFIFLYRVARNLGLEVLVEVQNEKELSGFFKLLPEDSGVLLGINSRNLGDLKINFENTLRLLSLVKGVKIPIIVESGIKSGRILVDFCNAGASGALIGTHLLRSKSPGIGLISLLKEMNYG